MSVLGRLAGLFGGRSAASAPRNAIQSAGAGALITNPQQLDEYLRDGETSLSGEAVTPGTAMRVAVVYACIRLLTSLPANLPLHLYRKVNERERQMETRSDLAIVLNRRPNRWQTPSQFRRMMTAHVKLRGNAYALIVRSLFGEKAPTDLIPLHPDRVLVVQTADMSLEYHYTRPDGRREVFAQARIMHLMGLTLNGYTGVTPITFLRETIGASLAMERQSSNLFRNGTQVGSVFKLPAGSNLDDAQYKRLKASLDEFKSQGERAGGTLLLEDGMDLASIGMTLVDAQWIESRKMSRADIAMAYGVPPHMIGDTEKTTSFGTGIESQNQGYLTYTAEDDLTMWEQAVDRDLIADPRSDLYARFNRSALVKGDVKTRTAAYASALQWGYLSPNEVRELEDRNPRDGGDIFYDPPNTAGGQDAATEKDPTDDTPPTA